MTLLFALPPSLLSSSLLLALNAGRRAWPQPSFARAGGSIAQGGVGPCPV